MWILDKKTYAHFTEVSTLSVLKAFVIHNPKPITAGLGGTPRYLGSVKPVESGNSCLFSPLPTGGLTPDTLKTHLSIVLLSLGSCCVK